MTATLLPAATVLLMGAAATGGGAAVLAALGLAGGFGRGEATCWSFALGFGLLGWLLLPLGVAGLLQPAALLALCVLLLPGLTFASRAAPRTAAPLRPVEWLPLAAIAAALLFDLLEGIAPPADADSLAYHFALPEQFLAAGRIAFVPRAVDGAVPLTVQMTYLPALALGGERAMTLWTMLSGWAAGALLYVLARHHLARAWALALVAVFLTTPAVIYGGGSGQIELRILLFTLTGAFAVSFALRGDTPLRWALLAGLCAGLFAGSKFTGLLFVAAAGVVLILAGGGLHPRLRRVGAFALGAAVAGLPWYLWNFWNSGDPLFPMLHGILPYAAPWDAAHTEAFREIMFGVERGVPTTLGWFLAYPFKATLDGLPQFDAGRTGFGPAALLLLPFAAAGLWHRRDSIATSPLLPLAAIVLIFYALWFFLGTAQRVRHLLPIYPLLLLCLTMGAARWQGCLFGRPVSRRPVLGAIALIVALQLGGHALFALSYAKHAVSDESRRDFLARTVANYEPVVPWINANLGPSHRVMLAERQLVYLVDVPLFYAHPQFQAEVDVRPGADDPTRFWREARALGITHVLFRGRIGVPGEDVDALRHLVTGLWALGCAETVKVFETRNFASRTLQTFAGPDQRFTLARLTPGGCALASGAERQLEPPDAPAPGAGRATL